MHRQRKQGGKEASAPTLFSCGGNVYILPPQLSEWEHGSSAGQLARTKTRLMARLILCVHELFSHNYEEVDQTGCCSQFLANAHKKPYLPSVHASLMILSTLFNSPSVSDMTSDQGSRSQSDTTG